MSHRAVAVAALTFSLTIAAITASAQSQIIGPAGTQTIPMSGNGVSVGSVSGSIQGLDGHPITDARIELKDLNNGSTLATTQSRTNGSFDLVNVPSGSYDIVGTSGLNETRERVQVLQGMAFVALHISAPTSDPSSSSSTVSVAQFKVPGKARKEFDKAQKAFSEGKLDDAKDHVGKALEIYPNFAEGLTLRGILAINEHRNEEGQADFQNAMKCDSNYAMAYLAMGSAMNQIGKFDEAIRTLERGVAIAPDAWQGYFEIAKASVGLGDFARALKSVDKASSLVQKDYAPIHLVKAHALLGLKQYQAAVAELEGLLRSDPQGSNAAYARQTLDRAKAFMARGAGSARSETSAGVP